MRVRAVGFGGVGRCVVGIRGEDECSGGERFSPLGVLLVWSPPGGLDLIEVCARWCPTLPHPGGCSTIGAVRLSFRVRDGYRAFPCRCDHRDDYMGSASDRHLWCGYSVIRVAAYPHTRACVVGGVGWVWTV